MTAPPRRCITVLYPNKPGVTFDFDYYLKQHATLIDRLYGASIATNTSKCLRNRGSPPVSRIFSTPCATNNRAVRVISSKLSSDA